MVQAGGDRKLDVDRLELAAALFVVALVHAQRLVPVDVRHTLVIEIDQQLLALDLPEGAEVAHVAEIHGEHLERVGAIRGEGVIDSESAAGAERQPLDMVVLCGVLGNAIGHLRR